VVDLVLGGELGALRLPEEAIDQQIGQRARLDPHVDVFAVADRLMNCAGLPRAATAAGA